jgi:hypothetical protein
MKGDFKNNDDIYPLIEKFDEKYNILALNINSFLQTLAEANTTN